MAGYANRTIRLEYPELSDADDLVFVVLRNPKTLPLERLMPPDVAQNDDGTLVDLKAGTSAMNDMFAGLIKEWHVYDGTSDADDQPLLGPPSRDTVSKLPTEIWTDISKQVTAAVTPR